MQSSSSVYLDADPEFTLLNQIRESLRRMILKADLSLSKYPYFSLTYTLWRQQKYKQYLDSIQHNYPLVKSNNLQGLLQPSVGNETIMRFHEAVDTDLLDSFISKCRDATVLCLADLKTKQGIYYQSLKDKGGYQQLIQEYSGAVASQLVAIEVLTDLVSMPYGFSIEKKMTLRPEFSAFPMLQQKKTNWLMQKLMSSNPEKIALKGVGKLGNELMTRMALGITTIVGGVNVLALAGGLAVNKLVEEVTQRLSQKKVQMKLRQQIQRLQVCSKALRQRYVFCRKLLKSFIRTRNKNEREIIRQQFQKSLKQIFYYDYSHKAVFLDEDESEQSEGSLKIIELQQQPWEQLSFN